MWLKENCGTAMKNILIALATLALAGCWTIGDSARPIGTETVTATKAAAERTLIVVLPGFGADAKEMMDRGVPKAIQEAWPEADVLLASATFAYYRDGRLVPRLHDEVIEPSLKAGYKHIWLAGASLGGMGALLYEQQHPGILTGVVLFAPFLGDNSLLREIRAAGGAQSWDPGPLPDDVNADNYQRQVWKMVKSWGGRPELANRVWLACGNEDRLLGGAKLLAESLPQAHYVELEGGHTWSTWLVGGRTVFSKIRNDTL
jgi:triacylglycerol esterase/lipase EstA (alpha/beta hydrolase family)